MTRHLSGLLTILIAYVPLSGIWAAVKPFKPYIPTDSIDYRRESLAAHSILPAGLLATSLLYNDNRLDKSIVKLGEMKSPGLQSANFLQYSPAAVMLTLKAAGLEGRSDWSRMLTADLISAALFTAVNNITKYTVCRERPDGTARNSYPSGHTGTAFLCAQMLHKEYGETVSPWISVGGYGLAATTGFFRALSDRHWCSDVLGGAAMGILSTEVAYLLTDRIYGDRRLRHPIVIADVDETPRWKFGLYSDYSIRADAFMSEGYGNPDAKPACSMGVDATWMPWYIGPTVRAGFTQMKWTGSDDIFLPDQGSVADVYTFGAGLDMDIPVINRVSLNGQAIAGYSPSANSYRFLDSDNQPLEWEIPAGMHCYANLGVTVRTSAFSSVTVHGGLDYYDNVWRSFVLGARFNYTF